MAATGNPRNAPAVGTDDLAGEIMNVLHRVMDHLATLLQLADRLAARGDLSAAARPLLAQIVEQDEAVIALMLQLGRCAKAARRP
jgi:hypothetical protein